MRKLIGCALVSGLVLSVCFLSLVTGCGQAQQAAAPGAPAAAGTKVTGTVTALQSDVNTILGVSGGSAKTSQTASDVVVPGAEVKIYTLGADGNFSESKGSGTADDNGKFTITTSATLPAGTYFVKATKRDAAGTKQLTLGAMMTVSDAATVTVDPNPKNYAVVRYVITKVVETLGEITFLTDESTKTIIDALIPAVVKAVGDLNLSTSMIENITANYDDKKPVNDTGLAANLDDIANKVDSGDVNAIGDAIVNKEKMEKGTALTEEDAEKLVKDLLAALDPENSSQMEEGGQVFFIGLAAALRNGVEKSVAEIRTAASNAIFASTLDPMTGTTWTPPTLPSADIVVSAINANLAKLRAGTTFEEFKAYTTAFPPGSREDITKDTQLNILKQMILFKSLVFGQMQEVKEGEFRIPIDPMKFFYNLGLFAYLPKGFIHAELHTVPAAAGDQKAIEAFAQLIIEDGDSISSVILKGPTGTEHPMKPDPMAFSGMLNYFISPYQMDMETMENLQQQMQQIWEDPLLTEDQKWQQAEQLMQQQITIIPPEAGDWTFKATTAKGATYTKTKKLIDLVLSQLSGLKVDSQAVSKITTVIAISNQPTISWTLPPETLPAWAVASGGYRIIIMVEKWDTTNNMPMGMVYDGHPLDMHVTGGATSQKLPVTLLPGTYMLRVQYIVHDEDDRPVAFGDPIEGLFKVQ